MLLRTNSKKLKFQQTRRPTEDDLMIVNFPIRIVNINMLGPCPAIL